MTSAANNSRPMETPKPEPSGGDGGKRPARANRGRDPKSTVFRRGTLTPYEG